MDPNIKESCMMMYIHFPFYRTEDIRKTFKYFFAAGHYYFDAPPLVMVLMTYPTPTHAKVNKNSSKVEFSALFTEM